MAASASLEIQIWLRPENLRSTDGIYGPRFAHNTEVPVAGLGVSKN